MAIVVFVTALTAAIIVLAILTFAPGLAKAADRPRDKSLGRMQACTAQWLDMKAAGHPPVYKTFIRECLAGKTVAAGLAAKPVSDKAVVANVRHVKAARKPLAEPVRLSAKVKKPSRMSECAAQWREKKVAGATDGRTYRQFSSQCLKRQ